MRVAVMIAVAVLCAGAPAIADDDTAGKPDTAGPANGGKLEVVPPPQGPAKPPGLTVPPAAPPPRDTGISPAPSENVEQHQEPLPQGQAPDALPRGEGAAAIPRETPTGIKAIEAWVSSWFE